MDQYEQNKWKLNGDFSDYNLSGNGWYNVGNQSNESDLDIFLSDYTETIKKTA